MHDGFKLVKRKRHKKQKSKIQTEFQIDFTRKSEKALEEFESSRFCSELLQTIDNCLLSIHLNSIEEIICFGIGNFLDSKPSLHQLAALIKLHRKYNSKVKVYDPVFTSSEIEFLKSLGFGVLTDNEEGKRPVSGKSALVFLPHCPKQLTNNFLWANWSTVLCNCILIANSFSRIIQDNTEKVLQTSANYILKIHSKAVEVVLEDSYHIENIFNDISVHYFPPQDGSFFSESLEEEPEYLGEIELIRKHIDNIHLNNEQ